MLENRTLIQENVRSLIGLAFLATFILFLIAPFAAESHPALAFSSPNSPVEPPRATAAPVQTPTRLPVTATATVDTVETPSAKGPDWQVPVGVGVIVIGLAFVVGGLIYLLRS